MTRNHAGKGTSSAADLRKQAETIAADASVPLPEERDALSLEEARRILHELRVHQIELEMQNEELRRVQAELDAARARYFDLYDLAPVGYCTVSEGGVMLEANLTAATLLGVSRDALVKQLISRFILKEDQDIYYLHRRQLFETLAPQAFDLRMVRATGSPFGAHMEATVAEGTDGLTACRIVLSDVSERNRGEEEARLRTAILEAQIDATLDGVLIVDGKGNKIVQNRRCVELWKIPQSIVDNRDDKQQVEFVNNRARDPGKFAETVAALYAHPDAILHDEVEFKDGMILERYSAPVVGRDGTHFGRIWTFHDVTAVKLAEAYREMGVEVLQILNESGEVPDSIQRVMDTLKTRTGFDAVGIRLRAGDDFPYIAQQGFSTDFLLTENTLVERGTDGGVCRDKNGDVCLECTCGLVLSGTTDPAQPFFTRGGSFWTNDSFPLLDLPPDQDPRHRPRNECIHQGYASVALVPIRTKDGIVGLLQLNDRRKGCFSLETVELLEGIGVHIGMALMRKREEDEKANLERELRQAQKMESVGRLAGGVAHDFNNLLMGIMGYADLCRDGLAAGHPVRCYVDEITEISQRSAALTRQLLAFARKQTIVPKVLNLNDTAEGMLKLLRRMIGENITLTWMPGAGLWPVKLDPSQIDQILANLCVNARDAIAGVGEITIATANVAIDKAFCATHVGLVPGAYVLLTVTDNGRGIEPDVLAKVFEPFFTTKATGEGTGLGLATVYGIVKQNNGFIDVSSEPHKGTTFRIYVPRCEGEQAKAPKAVAIEAPRSQGETVLLVEDEKSLRVTCGLFLEALGYKVLVADTPAAALSIAARHKGDIHLLITDVIMPDMNGREVAERLVASKPTLKVLFMSGYTADVIGNQKVLEEGMSFLQKPFSRNDLAHKVRAVLASTAGNRGG